jgi:hypothetical protein
VADTVGGVGGGVCVFVFELPPQPATMSETTNNPGIRACIIQRSFSLSIAENHGPGVDDELLTWSHVLGPKWAHFFGADNSPIKTANGNGSFSLGHDKSIFNHVDQGRRVAAKALSVPKTASRRLRGAMCKPLSCVASPYCTVRFT